MSDKELTGSEETGTRPKEWSATLKIGMPLGDAADTQPPLHIVVEGPMAGKTLALLSRPLLAAVETANRLVVLDLRSVPQIDSDGLSLLLNAHKALPAGLRPLSLRVVRGSQPERVLNMCGFATIMTLLTDMERPTEDKESF